MMNKNSKLLTGLLLIAAVPYSLLWFQTAKQVRAQGEQQFEQLQSHLQSLGGDLQIRGFSVTGYPWHFNLVLSDLQLTCPPTDDQPESTLLFPGHIELNTLIFGKGYTLTLPRKVLLETPTERYDMLFRGMPEASATLNSRPIQWWFDYQFYHRLPLHWQSLIASQADIVIPKGTLSWTPAQSEALPLLHWDAQKFRFQEQALSPKLNRVALTMRYGGITLDSGYFDWVKKQAFPEESFFAQIQTIEQATSYNGIVFQGEINADVPNPIAPPYIMQLHSKLSLGQGQWLINAEGSFQHKLQKDPFPVGTGNITLQSYGLLWTDLKALFPFLQVNFPLLGLYPSFKNAENFEKTTQFLETVGEKQEKTDKNPDSLRFHFERASLSPLLLNGKEMGDWLQKLEALLSPPKPVAQPQSIIAAPQPSEAELEAARRKRIEQWVKEYEKNLEKTSQLMEKEDQAHTLYIEELETLDETKKQAEEALSKSEERLNAIQVFETLHQKQEFAKPND